MPIVTVELLAPPSPPERLAIALADPLGTIFESSPGHTWVRVVPVDRGAYAESVAPGHVGPRPDVPAWAFVKVILRALPDEERRAELAAKITALVARESGRLAEDVHVLFEPPAAGRIAFGGELVRSR